jgi:hypothetical protein
VSKPDSLYGRTTSPEWWSVGRSQSGRARRGVKNRWWVGILFDPLHPSIVRGALHRVSRAAGNVYFEQIRVLKAGVSQRLNIAAWNDGIGPRSDFAGLFSFGPEVMVNRDGRGHSYCGDRGEILGPPQDEQQRRHLPRMFSLIKNES